MTKYRKKPVVIEAIQLTHQTKNQSANFVPCNCSYEFADDGAPVMGIQTLEGEMLCQLGDYIIKGVNGEFYPCKPDIFEKTYEKVD